jgi:GNAT superfamily N-acetyltransferase
VVETKTNQKVSFEMNEIEESNSLFHDVWSMYARGAGGEVVKQAGFIATWAGVQWPIVNVVFLTSVSSLKGLEDTLQGVARFVETKNQPGMLIACGDWLPDAADQLFQKHGWIQISQASGMVSEKSAADDLKGDLEYRRVDSQELRHAVADINAAAYAVSTEMAREALDHPSLWGDGCFGYVGFLDNTPVVTATTYLRAGCLYVALVATLPEFRARGFAKAITSYSIKAAQEVSGLGRILLHSTPMARSVYDSMGFRTVTMFPMFLPAALLG